MRRASAVLVSTPRAFEEWQTNTMLRELLDQLQWCEQGGCVHRGVVYMRRGSCPLIKAAKAANQEGTATDVQ